MVAVNQAIYQKNEHLPQEQVEPVKGVPMKIYQSDTYRIKLVTRQQVKVQQSFKLIFEAYLALPSSSLEHQHRNDDSIPCKAIW